MSQERTLPATRQRRQQLAQQGDVARSPELASTLVLLAILGLAASSFRGFYEFFQNMLHSIYSRDWQQLDNAAELQALLGSVLGLLASSLGSIWISSCVVCGLVQFAQTGRWSLQWPRRNPLVGFRQLAGLFSADSCWAAGLSLVKLVLLGCCVTAFVADDFQELLRAPTQPLETTLFQCSDILFRLSFSLTAGLLVVAIIDFGWRKLRYEQRIRMSPQEIREELMRNESSRAAYSDASSQLVDRIGSAGEARDSTAHR